MTPVFYVSDCLAESVIKQVDSRTLQTGALTFDPGAEELYRRLNGKHREIKVLRLLDAGMPEPKSFFSYEAQVFSCPQGIF